MKTLITLTIALFFGLSLKAQSNRQDSATWKQCYDSFVAAKIYTVDVVNAAQAEGVYFSTAEHGEEFFPKDPAEIAKKLNEAFKLSKICGVGTDQVRVCGSEFLKVYPKYHKELMFSTLKIGHGWWGGIRNNHQGDFFNSQYHWATVAK